MISSCYCSEIKRCKDDINKIEYVLIKLLDIDSTNHGILSTYVKNINKILEDSSTPDNLYDIQFGILKSNKHMECSICDMIDDCESKLKQLRMDLSYMETSDSNYHATLSYVKE